MIKNYFKTAFRNFWHNKVFSSINVLGLSIGISCSLVLFLIVYFEFSFDKFEKNSDRIYRVIIEMKHDGVIGYSAAVPAPLGAATEKEITGIEQTIPLFQFQGDGNVNVLVAKKNSKDPVLYKNQTGVIFTNEDYFKLLSYKWIAGSSSAMQQPFNVVLTESRAKQYFPNTSFQDVIGETITYGDSLKTTVTGIVKDISENTFFTSLEFISLPTVMQTGLKDNFMMSVWNDWMAYSQLFIKIAEGNTPVKAEANINALLHKYDKDANKSVSNSMTFRLQPLNEVHFYYDSFGHRTAHKPTLYGLLAIAGFLLLLGCINFINLTTANAAKRAKEIGIRKTLGGSMKQLVFQFLSETFFITVIATTIAITLTPLLLKLFSDLLPVGLTFDLFRQPAIMLFIFILTVVVSLIAGFYPAFVLSRFLPVTVLKDQASKNKGQTRSIWIRKSLTVTQFVIAQFFVIATLMVSAQINYTLNKDLGFKKDAILNFSTPWGNSVNNQNLLLQKLKAIPEIQTASVGFLPPATDGPAFTDVKYNDGVKDIKADVQIRWGDTTFLKLYQIKILAGRNVLQSDTIKEFVINETYSKVLGFQTPADALNKQLDFNGKKLPIVGVMNDFHEQSLHKPIDPVVFASFNSRNGYFHIALMPQNTGGILWQNAIQKIKKAYEQVYPENDFSYSFLDESIAKFYQSEEQTQRLLKWATGFAILISCLGLLGLVIYTTNTRAKEIGIRKVLGATVAQIVTILSKDFVKLILIAFVIAAPIAWWASYSWLQNFAFRVDMSWWIYVASGMGMVLIALFTLSLQTIKAAKANPVKSLRTE